MNFKKTKENAFNAASSSLGLKINDIFKNDGEEDEAVNYIALAIDQIVVSAQIREEFEDAENSLTELANSIKKLGLLQPILVRQGKFGKYELIAGERRLRASKLANLLTINAVVREMTDEEADDAQLAENIQRKNLTQIEEAKKIQSELNKLGSVKAFLEKHQKSHAWLSKTMSLLTLPEQAKRLVTENISADKEVINQVKVIEGISPERAKNIVDELATSKGKNDARDKVSKALSEVKPSKKVYIKNSETPAAQDKKAPLIIATPKDRTAELPSAPISVFPVAPEKPQDKAINAIYTSLKNGSVPDIVFAKITETDQGLITSELTPFFEEGKQSKNIANDILKNIRAGKFSGEGSGAFAVLAFFQGVDKKPELDILEVIKNAKG